MATNIRPSNHSGLIPAFQGNLDPQSSSALLSLPRRVLLNIFTMLSPEEATRCMVTCRLIIENDKIWKPLVIFKIAAWGSSAFSERIQRMPVTGFARIYPVVHQGDSKLAEIKADRKLAKRILKEIPPIGRHLLFIVGDALEEYNSSWTKYTLQRYVANNSVLLQCQKNLIERDLKNTKTTFFLAQLQKEKALRKLERATIDAERKQTPEAFDLFASAKTDYDHAENALTHAETRYANVLQLVVSLQSELAPQEIPDPCEKLSM